MKKKFTYVIAMLALICVLGASFLLTEAYATEEIYSGTCGENLTWVLDSDGVLTISGTGKMSDFSEGQSPWHTKRTKITSVVIEEGVTSIGNHAFYACLKMKDISIPNGITRVGYDAFQDCTKLEAVVLPEGVTSIGSYAFYNCSSLTSVMIPEGVNSIGSYTFYNCSSLTSVIIPEGVTYIDWHAFSNCSSLTSITIPEGVTKIGSYAFSNCSSLTNITIPESITSISDSAFEYCSSLTNITIPESITSIGNCVFSGCISLTSITIPESVTSIGYDAFRDCSSLTSITIPEGVTSIGYRAFSGCSSLTSITIPEGVTSIDNSAFSGCSSLTSITIPEGVTSIGSSAFENCSSLEEVHISDISAWLNIPFDHYSNPLCYGASLYLNGERVVDLVIPEGVTSIGNHAFDGCGSLSSIVIPEGVTSIGRYAFYNCSSLWHVLYQGTQEEWGDIEIDYYNRYLTDATRHYNCTGDEITDLENKVCTLCHTGSECVWGEGVVIQAPTCETPGLIRYTCTMCAQIKTEEIPATGHAPGKTVMVYVDGNDYYDAIVSCDLCGQEISRTSHTLEVNNLAIGDVNGDGIIDVRDAMMIAQYVAGFIDQFPAAQNGQ